MNLIWKKPVKGDPPYSICTMQNLSKRLKTMLAIEFRLGVYLVVLEKLESLNIYHAF